MRNIAPNQYKNLKIEAKKVTKRRNRKKIILNFKGVYTIFFLRHHIPIKFIMVHAVRAF